METQVENQVLPGVKFYKGMLQGAVSLGAWWEADEGEVRWHVMTSV